MISIILSHHPKSWRVKRVTDCETKMALGVEDYLKRQGQEIDFVCDTTSPLSLFKLGACMGEYSCDEQTKIKAILSKL